MTRSGPTRERRNRDQRRARRRLTTTVAATALALTGTFAAVPASAAPAGQPVARAGSTGSLRLVDIPMKDGVVLKADVLTPAPGTPGADAQGRYPVVVEPASWGQNDLEYLMQSRKLAADGYVVVTYTVRGFWLSGGQVDVAGPKDVADISSVIDWTLAHTPADPRRIGMTGLSLGAGMSLMGAAFDPRVKAVAAMSAWGDLVNALYGGRTRHVGAAGILTAVQIPTGRQSPETHEAVNDMFTNQNIPELVKWAKTRSPGTYVDRINAHHTAVFIANAWTDSIFNPSQVADFYQKLTGPKRLELRPGDHATQEIGGMLGLDNPAWDDGRAWFDQHLKNLDGDAADHRVQLQVRENAGQEQYPDWRSISTHAQRLELGRANLLGTGTLGGAPDTGWQTSIMGGVDSGADSGITELSGGMDQFLGIPPTVEVPLLPRAVAAVWQSAPYSDVQHIRGAVGFHTTVTSSSPKGTVFAYLYDVNALGVGRLITHAPQSWSSTPGQAVPLDLSLFATAYDLPAGHRLALVLDTKDPMYGSDTPLGSRLSFGSPANDPSRLTVPLR
ncbi:CocE/NonD family hydrolase [Streptomyces silvisoli]|uniref:CocE/NonD family hydrolase n=1 Tax=Streptomyces silvisoli TaxID=3034235 RepID=A0ABT5ZCV0_9ACTN|nr:CocE/NonD family hydrolase [Streptomyces silvisoli]MDF3287658.1 CocE/NonD family hydrolase [Streptomyces silvisoli]